MPADQTLAGLIPVLQEFARELYPDDTLRRVLVGERGAEQSEGATWAGPFGQDYVELDPGRTREELLRQVRAWQMMLDRTVVGPVVTVDGRRLHVRDASLDEPDEPDTLRLDAVDALADIGDVSPAACPEGEAASHVRDAAAAAGSRPCDATGHGIAAGTER
jgi:hypothetical protein